MVQSMEAKSIIVIPVRDRQVHLDCLLGQLNKYFSEIPVCIVEQDDKEPWNKGLLFNAAVKELPEYNYFVFHDTDFIPHIDVSYQATELPCLLSTECSQFNYTHMYPTFFGGVVGIPRNHYETINGMSNKFQGWGAEDDFLYKSFVSKGINPIKCTGNRFENFAHPRPNTAEYLKSEQYHNNLDLLMKERDFSEGLSTCTYSVSGREITHRNIQDVSITHLKIKTK